MSRSAISAALLLLALTLSGGVGHADITIEERISLKGSGIMSMANMSGKTVTTIAGKRGRTESDLQMQSRLVRLFAPDGKTAQIVRLDEDTVYELQLDKKRYTATSLAEHRARLQQALDQQQQAQAQQQQTGSGVDESQCEWLPPKVEVMRTGEKGTFAGFDAERVTVSAVQSCKVKDSNQVCDFGLSLDQWVAPRFEGDAEAIAFQRAYAEQMGLTAAQSGDLAERAEALFGRYEDLWRELGTKMRDIKGYPVKASFGFGMGGPQCQDLKEGQADSPAQRPGDIVGQIGGAIGGMFGKKKDKAAEQAAAAETGLLPNGLTPMMVLTSELVSVSRASVSPQEFEIPPDFQKVDASQ
jgi:hypothetical protein